MQASTTNAEEPKKGPQQTKIAALFLREGAVSEAVIGRLRPLLAQNLR